MTDLRYILIPPILAVVLNTLLGRWWDKRLTATLACGSILASFWVSLMNTLSLAALPEHGPKVLVDQIFSWIAFGRIDIQVDLVQDPLSSVMCLVITGVGFLIHLYSVGYMSHDPGFRRFFIYLNLFVSFMLLLVLADNLAVLFVGWEGVGLCSYLLIGFWHADMKNASAGKKAFVVNRVGDLGFLLGMLLILETTGTLSVAGIQSFLAVNDLAAPLATLICLFLFVGATGKSAQIPLYVWLPDAMAGPTPVSALIHAATMVTAGVYMIARLHFLYALSPVASAVVACVGAATAIYAAVIGIAQTDIKKVLAYSTVSQLGYMFLAVGLGAYTWGIFHLTTHAFFKALLFLGSGSVIHALSGEQDLRRMGALRISLPITFWTMLTGTLAIAGVPPLAGFFSKDEILLSAKISQPLFVTGQALFLVGLAAAFLTAFYMGRLLILTFLGESRVEPDRKHHLHESPWTMTAPLAVLAVLSAVAGFGHHAFAHWLSPLYGHGPEVTDSVRHAVEGSSIAIGLSGLALAVALYLVSPGIPGRIASGARFLHRLIENKFYVDELYEWTVVKGVHGIGVVSHAFDAHVVDRLVNWTGGFFRIGGFGLSFLQTGQVSAYAVWFLIGVSALLALVSAGIP